MNATTERCARWRPSLLTVIVLSLVAAGIALANLSSEPITVGLIKTVASRPERAYGWPLTWYWREASSIPGSVPPWNGLPPRPELVWPVARYSTSGLIVNLAIWLVLLAASTAVCQRVRRKHQSRLSWQRRLTTLLIALFIVAPTVLANMTFEERYFPPSAEFGMASYGWPFVWHWYWVAPDDDLYGWDFNAARLAGNIVVWLGTLVLVALFWEWMLRRYQPRLRFSLRTMLAALTVVALLCAWCAAVWKRADEQDALVASGLAAHQVWVERLGPKWLRLIIPDRYRRRVVGASICIQSTIWPDQVEEKQDTKVDQDGIHDGDERNNETQDDGSHSDDEIRSEEWERQEEELLERLGRLPALHYLSVGYGTLTPAMADSLANVQQVRILHVGIPYGNYPGRPTNLAWIGRLGQLEHLSLERVDSTELGFLANLTRLKSLTLDLTDCEDDESEMDKRLAAVGKLSQLRRLHLQGSPGDQIAHLSALTNLKSLALDFDHFYGDEKRLRQCFVAIGKLTQIEELRLGAANGLLSIRPDNLASLCGLNRLTTLWLRITCDKCDTSERQACLAALAKLTYLRRLWLDGYIVTSGLAELAPLQSLEELRISDPGMETAAAVESLAALKSLKSADIPALAVEVFPTGSEATDARRAAAHRAFELWQRSHPGRMSNLWLEEQSEFMPWGDWEEFNEREPDLDSFLGGNPMVGA